MIFIIGALTSLRQRETARMAAAALAAATAVLLAALVIPAWAGEPTAAELLDRTDDVQRGQSSHSTITMNVKTERWDRSLTIETWTQGEEQSLMVIRAPAKEAGMATLKVEDNIWNYLPKVDRTMKVPASMMSGSWMGSHFSNDDLVKESRMADDYTFAFTSTPADGGANQYVIECIPRPDAPVVWGKVVVTIDGTTELPTAITYWDEKGNLKRTMEFTDVQDLGGRKIPCRMKLLPADDPGEFTEVIYDDIEFDIEIPAETFTLQALKQ
jgi:outer membrane lipoprotein-sorting protein